MPQVIVIETEQNHPSTKTLLEALKKAGLSNCMLVAQALPPGTVPENHFFSLSKDSLTNSVHKAASQSEGQLLFVNSQASLEGSQLDKVIKDSSHTSKGALSYVPLKGEKGLIDFPEAKAEDLVPFLARVPAVPFLAISVDKGFVEKHTKTDCETPRELMAQFFMQAAGEGQKVARCPTEIPLKSAGIPEKSLRLTSAESARCLRLAAELSNIEELFPKHEWKKFQNESMAASYHTLAAVFIHLNDLESAQDCIKQSEPLEDSPRTLALKALISLKRHEHLGAAGNMITSLQQYETRKRSSESHYLSFNPKDFEQINNNLKTGLDALNRKDNQTAVRHFAAAIFQFDPFYHENGIDNIEALMQ